jgi:hypothetical protein
MKAILDTLPELPEPLIQHRATFATVIGFTADQLREDRRIVAEHVVRACAEELRGRANRMNGPWSHAMNDSADRILALLEPKS